MNNPTLYYCYDAYCGWCYGFSPVIRQIEAEFRDKFFFEVLSGGMILTEQPRPVKTIAEFVLEEHKTVEAYAGVRFGEDYLWHMRNPDQSDWFPSSEKAAIALCVFKEYHPAGQIAFAADLQYALQYEGRDLCDDEAYRHLLEKYELPDKEFYERLKAPLYKDKAYYEFELVKQLQVTGFPSTLLQVDEAKFYLLSRGFTDYVTLRERIVSLLNTSGLSNEAPPS